MRSLWLLPLFALVGCEDTVEDAGSVAYEGRSVVAPSPIVEDPASPSIDGRYGASAADCDEDNRYMTEYVELEDGKLSYRGSSNAIAIVRENEIQLRGGERLERVGDDLVRWPDDRRKRTVYTRCPNR